jgi:hypothetical protein
MDQELKRPKKLCPNNKFPLTEAMLATTFSTTLLPT